MREVFMLCAADYDNIGDALIRRRALEWLRGSRGLHVYLGSGGPDWSEALRLPPEAKTYHRHEMQGFVRKLVSTHRPVLVFDPGELPLTAMNRRFELAFLILTVIARLRRGDVVRLPRGVKGTDKLAVLMFRLAVRLSQVTTWRNKESLDFMRTGFFVPDLAIGEVNTLPTMDRDRLVISLRGDRPLPQEAWFEGIAAFAARHALRVTAVAQVRSDGERARALADRLQSECVLFESRSISEQEELLREIYNETSLVISDRLHVLVLATDQGAAPVELVSSPVPKIRQHFVAIGVTSVSVDASGLTAAECVAVLEHALDGVGEVQHRFALAAQASSRLEAQVRALISD